MRTPARLRPIAPLALVLVLALPVDLRAQAADPGVVPVKASAPVTRAPRTPLDEIEIRPGDLVRVRVWPDSALSGDFPVDGAGFLHLPLLGRFQAAGRSASSIAEEIRLGYNTELKNPVVLVTPLMRVSVLGAVRAPGLYQVDPSFSILDVISLAGGFTHAARPNRVRLVRDGESIGIDLRQTLDSGGTAGETAVRSGDRIVVPDRGTWLTFGNFFSVLQAALGVMTLVNVMK